MSKYLAFKAAQRDNEVDKTASVPWYADPMAQAGLGAGLGGLAGAGLGYGLGGWGGALAGGLGGAALGGGLGYMHGMHDPFGFTFAMLSDEELKEAIVAAKQANDPIVEVLMQELQRRDQGMTKISASASLHPYWRDKIAAAAEEAEAVLAQEAAAEDQAAMKQGAPGEEEYAAKLEEDILIAQELVNTDLPLETIVEVMEEYGVEPEVIEEVIEGETVDAVAAAYGVNPDWLRDKTAAITVHPSLLKYGIPAAAILGGGYGVYNIGRHLYDRFAPAPTPPWYQTRHGMAALGAGTGAAMGGLGGAYALGGIGTALGATAGGIGGAMAADAMYPGVAHLPGMR